MSIISTEKFSYFIIKTLASIDSKNPVLASYCSIIENIDLKEKIQYFLSLYEKSLSWSKPKENYEFIGLGELISVTENGKGRFAASEKKIKPWIDNFVNNWEDFEPLEIPLFLGGMKFTSESSTHLWENFQDSNWFVPKILLMNHNNCNYLIYNLLLTQDSSKDKIETEYNLKLKTLFEEKNHTKPNELKLLSITGDSPKEKKKWVECCKKAVNKVNSGEVEKVVLSRQIEISLSEEPEITKLTNTLKQNYPECYLFLYHSGKSTYFGASPEKLMKITPSSIETDALAGSAPRGKNEIEDKTLEDDLLNSKKNIVEHNTVVQHLKRQLSKIPGVIENNNAPCVKKFKNIQHLWTPINLKTDNKEKIFNIIELLHPTPAVCGLPIHEALHTIKELEDFPRGLYSGVIGWFNHKHQGEFTVAIRSALLKGKKIYAFAGSGIVEGSDPNLEYEETNLKLKPILSLFQNENKNQ